MGPAGRFPGAPHPHPLAVTPSPRGRVWAHIAQLPLVLGHPVATPGEILADPPLMARDLWVRIEGHTRQVLADILGMSDAQIMALEAAGVLQ